MHFGFHRCHHNKAYCTSLFFLELTVNKEILWVMKWTREIDKDTEWRTKSSNNDHFILIQIIIFRDYYEFNCRRWLYVFLHCLLLWQPFQNFKIISNNYTNAKKSMHPYNHITSIDSNLENSSPSAFYLKANSKIRLYLRFRICDGSVC